MVNRGRTAVPFLLLTAFFAAVGIRLFFVQIWHHDELDRRVQRLTFRERPETPCRGRILDKQGRILAMSVKSYKLFLDPRVVRDMGEVESRLASLKIAIPRDVREGKRKTSYVPLGGTFDEDAVSRIKAWKLAGVGFEPGYRRQYPEGRTACHVLGVVGRDGAGLEGVEHSYNGYLSGEKVSEVCYRDGRGREISEKLVEADKLRGGDVSLTIDRNLQFIAEQEIDRAWRESRSKRAMAVVQDPKTGEILAIACRPSFDPENFAGDAGNLKNPAVSDIFEPGSTFKLVTVGATLEEKAASTSESIWCEDGKYTLFNHTISDHEKKGFLTVPQIMEVSSNIGCAKLGARLGKERMYRYVRQFGFASLTGVDLPGEARGLLRNPSEWSGLSLPVISFGQEVGTTALQVVNAYSAVVNGGLLLEPKVVSVVQSPSGKPVYRRESRVIRRVLSPKTAEAMRRILVRVVESGTGQMARVPGYSVGGKTGTAQKRDPSTGRYSSSRYVASFCGALPMSDPRLTILVILDEPQGDYWASSRAAPVFARIASRSVGYLKIEPDQAPATMVCAKKFASIKVRKTSHEN